MVQDKNDVSYINLQRGATMGDGTVVWSMKLTAAVDPTQIAFVESPTIPATSGQMTALADTLTNVTLNTAAVSQNTTWNNLSGAKYLIIGGNAKVVTAAFVTDANAMTTYQDNTATAATSTAGVTYQLAVVTENNGTVTPGTVTAPAAPASSDESVTFDKWRALVGTAPHKTETLCEANASVDITDNTVFNADWKPATLNVTLNRNGGTGGSNVTSVTYGNKLTISENPTRSGFAFDGWTVSEAVTENGIAYAKGSTFDLNTLITADLKLTAQWKHVHSYTCYKISDFGNSY